MGLQIILLLNKICTLSTVFEIIPAAVAKSLQLCPTLCDPIDGSPPGSSIPGILEARTLEWVAMSFSNAWKWRVKVKSLSRARLLATPGTAAHQAPASMGFSRQEYWSGVPLPSLIIFLMWVLSSVRYYNSSQFLSGSDNFDFIFIYTGFIQHLLLRYCCC